MDAEAASVIGARARMIRRRRGLSLDVVAGSANDARYAMAGQGMGTLLAELQVHAAIDDSQQRRSALAALAEIKPEGGPTLGRFILQRTSDKWYITGHETEKC
jgi:hypothetical protein